MEEATLVFRYIYRETAICRETTCILPTKIIVTLACNECYTTAILAYLSEIEERGHPLFNNTALLTRQRWRVTRVGSLNIDAGSQLELKTTLRGRGLPINGKKSRNRIWQSG